MQVEENIKLLNYKLEEPQKNLVDPFSQLQEKEIQKELEKNVGVWGNFVGAIQND